ncbi:N-lysine methyltransferase KMT5A-like [Xyrauchen texanus]|uniref:N-lysine methyltransferase KMT5A-like n=1 Tax=Xyrauchen texanus TaxID=154827 RepID=UPI002241BBA4|nr:N-lysine methyltransferase KMT5A-like [Xyrauchen texanus]
MEYGFPEDRVFYKKWRASQYTKRLKHLLSYFTLRKPSAAKVARRISQEGWTVNCLKPEKIMLLWKPAPKQKVEEDGFVIQCVSQQNWMGLAIKDFGAEQGLGVVTTRRFYKNDIVCDYHGKVITAAEGRAMVQSQHDEPGYVFFFKAGQRELCVDAQTFPCECHPHANTFGRRINHSCKMPNLKPFHCSMKINGEDKDIILFKALNDISVGTQLKFD